MSATAAPARTFDRLAALPLRVDGYELSGLELPLTPTYTRMTTVVHMRGAGLEGVGEDTTYAMPDQLAFRAAGATLPLAGEWTLGSFSSHLAELDMFPTQPLSDDFREQRRWAFESAALDLALRQAGLSLPEALGRTPRPVRFVVSPGPEADASQVLRRLEPYPSMRLKLMAVPGWEEATWPSSRRPAASTSSTSRASTRSTCRSRSPRIRSCTDAS